MYLHTSSPDLSPCAYPRCAFDLCATRRFLPRGLYGKFVLLEFIKYPHSNRIKLVLIQRSLALSDIKFETVAAKECPYPDDRNVLHGIDYTLP